MNAASALVIFIAIGTLGICASIMAYARGYRAGCAYCMAELKPVQRAAQELSALTLKSRAEREARAGRILNDPISELMSQEGLSYPDAVEKLARIAGSRGA